MPKQFRGSYTVTITPFTADGKKIDIPAWKRFVDWQIKLGVPGIIILGTTGEFLTVSDEERRLFVETTVKHVRGRMHVLVGTMNAYTPHAVRYSREAEELGADGLMIIPPYYYTPTDDEIFNYYKAICEKVSIPIMLYNNPFTSNVDMSAKLVARLTKAFEQVRYIKEASMDVARVYDVIEETKGVMNVFAGERIVESLSAGRHRLCEPLRQLHPARLLSHLRLHRRGPHRGGEEDRAAHQQDAGHHQRGPSDLRPPVLFQGAGRGRRLSGRRCAAAAHDLQGAGEGRRGAAQETPADHAGTR